MQALCIYCGSSPGRRPEYADAARSMAGALVERNIKLIYGGGSVGLMGTLADAVLQQGGQVEGVIPEALLRKEVGHQQLSKLHVTHSMHERKMLMADLADGFIALPGGLGTLEELFEIWTWAQLGFHRKPCGMLNVTGFFDPLISFLDHTVSEQFVKATHRSILIVAQDPADLLDRMAAYTPPATAKWVNRRET
jgi:hypothetical protein